uniref:Uncharacterized protein n=1 Tax=Trichobilharzia regenti TaxID=157069 RepID=A0AA85IZW3_TRIRE|nr:unnamed protein product [Trichobilharzia regenti]
MPDLPILVQNYFRTVQVLRGFERSRTRHRQSLIPLSERSRLMKEPVDENSSSNPTDSNSSRWNKARQFIIEERERQSAN